MSATYTGEIAWIFKLMAAIRTVFAGSKIEGG